MTAPQPQLPLSELMTDYSAARRYSVNLVDGLDRNDIMWRPNENSSAIGWHLGHQAAVNHYMVRNLTAAEPSLNVSFDTLFDSATEEPSRGSLPPLDEILDYRQRIESSTSTIIDRIASGDVGAPSQLTLIADGLLRAVINHEYQHATWMREVRDTMTTQPAPLPESDRLIEVEGYWLLAP